MSNEITGTLIKILPKESKNNWEKIPIVIETSGEYPKKVCLEAWGKTVQYAEKLKEGQTVKVSFNPESTEYNGKWYTTLKAYRIDKA